MKCTIFLFTFHFYMCAGHAFMIQARTTHARTTHMRHTCLSRTKTKVQSKVQLRGEMVSVHEDVKPIGIGE